MRNSIVQSVIAILLAVVVFSSSASAGEFNEMLSIGDAAPAWQDFSGTDDKQHALADYQDAKVIVQFFTCNGCPVAIAYEDRMIALQKEYQDKGVQFVAINVNVGEGEALAVMKERASAKDYNFPYLKDDSQQSATEYGARVTPDVVVLDGDRKVAYLGAVDDNMKSSKVTKTFLRDALDAVLAGKAAATAETSPFGCGIKWK